MAHGKTIASAALIIGCMLIWLNGTLFHGLSVAAQTEATATPYLQSTPTAYPTTVTPSATPSVPAALRRFQRIGAFGGESTALALAGSLAFVGEGYRVSVYDVSNPASPTRVSLFQRAVTPRRMQIVGDRLFISDSVGLHIVTFQDPTNLVEIGTLALSGIMDMYVAESAAYVIVYSDVAYELRVIDLRGPGQLAVGALVDIQYPQMMAGDGDMLYVSSWTGNGIFIVDARNTAAPVVRGQLPLYSTISRLEADGTTLFIVGSGKLSIADVRDPDHPVLLGAYASGSQGYRFIRAFGSTAYVIRPFTQGSDTDTLEILDVSTPAAPVLRQSIDVPKNSYAIEVRGQQAFLLAPEGVTILNIDDVQPPAVIGRVAESGRVQRFAADNTQMYIVSGQTLSIYEMSDPAAPSLLGQYVAPYPLYHVVVANGIAYLAAGESGGMLTVDVHDGHAPRLLGRYLTVGNAQQVALAAPLVYVADGLAGMTILDVSNPAQPVLRGRYTEFGVYNLILDGAVVYAVTQHLPGYVYYQLDVVDIRDPAKPYTIGSLPGTQIVQLFQVVDGTLYAIAYDSGYTGKLAIIDVRQPAAPMLLAAVATTHPIIGVAVAAGRAFAMTSDEIEVFDVRQPQSPLRVTREDVVPVGSSLSQIMVFGDTVYVADGPNGVVALRFDSLRPPPRSVLLPVVVQALPTATAYPSFVHFTFDVENYAPAVNSQLLTSGDLTTPDGKGIAGIEVTVSYISDGTGIWCNAITDSDGYWECTGTVTSAMSKHVVVLLAKATVNGENLGSVVRFVPE